MPALPKTGSDIQVPACNVIQYLDLSISIQSLGLSCGPWMLQIIQSQQLLLTTPAQGN